jgi:signal transduction histidine kinase
MDQTQKIAEQFMALAGHLAARRSAILQAWRESVRADAELTVVTALPRTQFDDHIPRVLDAFERKLRVWSGPESAVAEEQRREDSATHGLQRWQQGYRLREVTREWGHLQLCLVTELENYTAAKPELEPGVRATAILAIMELCNQGIGESTTRYFQLQQLEAEGEVRDLQATLKEVIELDGRRIELFRQAAHDLRGNVGVVHNVTTGLTEYDMPETIRDEMLRLLQKSVSSLHSMLDEVLDLARLQAGHEVREVKPIDAALLLRELSDNLQPLATERGLFLSADGPATLAVEGDAVKIRRIAQNLLLNGLKYTQSGGVRVVWGDSRDNDPKRWMLWVQDSGPGFNAGASSPVAEALKDATAESRQIDENTSQDNPDPAVAEPGAPVAAAPELQPARQESGEGIGLSIVKRLCDLLEASMELESNAGEGTTWRVMFPRRYDVA